MPRIRSIKPEWLDDEKLIGCTPSARVLSVALIILADDHGNGRANELLLAGRVFPMSKDPSRELRESLAQLSGWYASLYEVRGQHYYHLVNWSRHQKVDHPGKPIVPLPDIDSNINELAASDITRESLAKVSRKSRA